MEVVILTWKEGEGNFSPSSPLSLIKRLFYRLENGEVASAHFMKPRAFTKLRPHEFDDKIITK